MTEPRVCAICGVSIETLPSWAKTCGAEACKKQHNIEQRARYRAENRDARVEYERRYRAENRDAILGYDRRYREENRDAIREKQKHYQEENRDARLEYDRRYREENRDARLEYDRRYRIENLDAMRERDRCYRVENRDAILEYSRRYRVENRDAIKEIQHRQNLRCTITQEIVRSFGVTLTGNYRNRSKQALDILHELGITNQEIDQWIAQAQMQDDTNNSAVGDALSSTRDSLSLTAKPTI